MAIRPRSLAGLVVLMASSPGFTLAQDSPLYRDPSPTEGPRIEGPILSPRPPRPGLEAPPPPSTLGPFQSSETAAVPASEPLREPLLGIPPIAPPLPALPMPPMFSGDDVQIKRKTTVWGPKGVLGQFHEWFHDTLFGPPKPKNGTTPPKHGLFAAFHHALAEEDITPRRFKWPTWPLSGEH